MFGGYSTRQKVDEEEHLKKHGGLSEEIRMKTCLKDQMNYAKTLNL